MKTSIAKKLAVFIPAVLISPLYGSGKFDAVNIDVVPALEFQQLEHGLSAVLIEGDRTFDSFLFNGGASSDKEVVSFLKGKLLGAADPEEAYDFSFGGNVFGCSTVAAVNSRGEHLFGRNFDWEHCNALVTVSKPDNGYMSISTVNLNFIQVSGFAFSMLSDRTKALISLYAPLDGMNEMGLVVSVNMIQDSASINQQSSKPDITTTTAVRLLLNKAADVPEALALLEEYDMHASMGLMVHFIIADAHGRSVAVEYIGNEMHVVESPVVTNFYLAQGPKYGIGTAQSHTRFEILSDIIKTQPVMEMDSVRDALSRVSKKNFNEFASTEWSIVFNQTTGQADYYHRENYARRWSFRLQK